MCLLLWKQEKYQREQEKLKEEWEKAQREVMEEEKKYREEVCVYAEGQTWSLTLISVMIAWNIPVRLWGRNEIKLLML